MSNFQVIIKTRPLIGEETNKSKPYEISGEKIEIVKDDKLKKFSFDKIIEGKENLPLFEDVQENIDKFQSGYNSCLMVQGQTGSGKTQTISGSDKNNKMSTNSILFKIIESHQTFMSQHSQDINSIYDLKLKIQQVQKEKCQDLLSDQKDLGPPLKIRQDANVGYFLEYVNEVNHSASSNLFAQCVDHALSRRVRAAHLLNDYSSRSHCIQEFTLTKKTITGGASSVEFKSTLQVVDLAGCEQMHKTGSGAQMSAEGKDINKSMLVLARVIMDLSRRARRQVKHKEREKEVHLPWRDSKLTMLLQRCMDGNAQFSFVACLSPLLLNQSESINTLEQASFCKNIVITPQKVEDPVTMLINRLNADIKRLKNEIDHKDKYIDMLVDRQRDTKMYICDKCNELPDSPIMSNSIGGTKRVSLNRKYSQNRELSEIDNLRSTMNELKTKISTNSEKKEINSRNQSTDNFRPNIHQDSENLNNSISIPKPDTKKIKIRIQKSNGSTEFSEMRTSLNNTFSSYSSKRGMHSAAAQTTDNSLNFNEKTRLINEIKLQKKRFQLQNDTITELNSSLKEAKSTAEKARSTADSTTVIHVRLENELLNIREEYDLLLDILKHDEGMTDDLEQLLAEKDPTMLNDKLKKVINNLKLEIFNYNLLQLRKDKKKKKRF